MGFGPSTAYAGPSIPIGFIAAITGVEEGTQSVDEDELILRNFLVTAAVTGDIIGTATYVVNYNVDLLTNESHLWGDLHIEVTGGPCVGSFDGTFNGTSTFDPNTGALTPDIGDLKLSGSGGCKKKKIKADFDEPVDGLFEIAGTIK